MTQNTEGTVLLGGTPGALADDIAACLTDEGWDVVPFDEVGEGRPALGLVVVLGGLVEGRAGKFSQNTSSVFGMAEAAVRLAESHLAEGGSVVVVSPPLGSETTAGIAGTSLIQRGVLGLVRGLAVELGDKAIRSNAVLPGILDDQPPLPGTIPLIRGNAEDRRGTARDVADAVAFLLSSDAAYITGVELVVDGGLSQCRSSGSFALWDAGLLDAFTVFA